MLTFRALALRQSEKVSYTLNIVQTNLQNSTESINEMVFLYISDNLQDSLKLNKKRKSKMKRKKKKK